MAMMRLDFVSQDHLVFSGDVKEVIAPGSEGQLTILPMHAALITTLQAGEMVVRRDDDEDLFFAISGGWMEVRPNHVTVLSRTAELADEISVQRAEQARARAEQLLVEGIPQEQRVGIEMALRRSEIRLKVARRRRGSGGTSGRDEGG